VRNILAVDVLDSRDDLPKELSRVPRLESIGRLHEVICLSVASKLRYYIKDVVSYISTSDDLTTAGSKQSEYIRMGESSLASRDFGSESLLACLV